VVGTEVLHPNSDVNTSPRKGRGLFTGVSEPLGSLPSHGTPLLMPLSIHLVNGGFPAVHEPRGASGR
jgi:hypothetical protein